MSLDGRLTRAIIAGYADGLCTGHQAGGKPMTDGAAAGTKTKRLTGLFVRTIIDVFAAKKQRRESGKLFNNTQPISVGV